MFNPVSVRAASAYKRVGVETSVGSADPHQLIAMLFDGLLQSLRSGLLAMRAGQVGPKCEMIGKAVRIIDEGLVPCLNLEQGGELAGNLSRLYEYALMTLIQANLHNDEKKLTEVIALIEPVAQAWTEIRGSRPLAN